MYPYDCFVVSNIQYSWISHAGSNYNYYLDRACQLECMFYYMLCPLIDRALTMYTLKSK